MNEKGDHIILVGMSASGKTSLGEALSIALNITFIDTDEEIEKKAAKSISEIFQSEGEAQFRSYEQGIIRQLIDFPKSVIAVGGGLPCHNNHMDVILDMGRVIYLDLSVDVLVGRLIKNSSDRPLYAGLDFSAIEHKTRALKSDRERFYQRAHKHLDASKPIPELVKEVIENLS
jgi:shikimate kinase